MRNQPLTVGRLRELLSEFHESDIVLVAESNLLYKVEVAKQPTYCGVAVIIERGDRFVG